MSCRGITPYRIGDGFCNPGSPLLYIWLPSLYLASWWARKRGRGEWDRSDKLFVCLGWSLTSLSPVEIHVFEWGMSVPVEFL